MKYSFYRLLLAAVLSGITATALAQSNIYVATNGDDAANSGQSWASPYATISNGIAKAPTAGDTVWVSNGTYVLSAQLSIANAITVSAWSANASNTIIDGNYPARTGRCVNITAAATLSRFTITNGFVTNGYGGGVYMSAGMVTGCVIVNNTIYTNIDNGYNAHGGGGVYMTAGTVKNCEIRNNRAWDCAGGGVCNRGATVQDSTIEGNIATNGGGVYMWNGGVLRRCTIRANRCNDAQDSGYDGGGGVLAQQGYVYDCLIEENTNSYSSGNGGGVHLSSPYLMTNCIISKNVGGNGAGVLLKGSTSPYARVWDCVINSNRTTGSGRGGGGYINNYGVLDRCTIMGNSTSDRGAGVYATRGGQIRNCLIVGNSNSANTGGGMMLEAIQTYGGYVDSCTVVSNYAASGRGAGIDMNNWDYGTTPTNGITNCVAYFNWGGGDIYPATAVLLSNVWYSSSTVALPANQGNITPSDPQFVDRNAGNYRLTKDSPCVNAGTNEAWMANSIDRDMRMRIRYGRVDMGAYEVIYSGSIYSVH